MKKLSIILAVMLALLAGCIQILPEGTPATAAPAPTVVSPAPAVTPGPTADDTIEPAVSAEPTETPVLGPPPALPVVSDRVLSYENEHIDVDIHCPEISDMLDGAFQQEANDAAYYDLKDMAAGIEQESIDDPMPASIYYLNSAFTVRRNDGAFLSISQSVEFYNGGANVGTTLKFINLKNTVPGQRLALADLFQPGADYITIISEKIRDTIAASPDMSDFTFSEISESQGFYLTDSALVIVFQKYDIAPGVLGPQEFTIPLADLGDVLIPELS